MGTFQKPLFSKEQDFKQEFHIIQKDLTQGDYSIEDLGSILPASVMVHDLENFQPRGISYMNNWGCERLGTSADEINALGDAYYSRYFLKEESQIIFDGFKNFFVAQDFSKQYNFFQRVMLNDETQYKWFYTVCKLIKVKTNEGVLDKMILLSSPVEGMNHMINRVNKVLDEDIYIKSNYKVFALLTKREKVIITLIAHGKSSKEIANDLFISIHTVSTHRKNIIQKTGLNSFASLVKFAMAFELV